MGGGAAIPGGDDWEAYPSVGLWKNIDKVEVKLHLYGPIKARGPLIANRVASRVESPMGSAPSFFLSAVERPARTSGRQEQQVCFICCKEQEYG
jgi:hypothetical protein